MKDMSDGFIAMLEEQENSYWNSYYKNASEELKKNLEIHTRIINGAYCYALSNADILAFNRVICIGIEGIEVTKKQLDEIKDFYKSAGSKRFFIQVSPVKKQDQIIEFLKTNGFKYHNNWAKFVMKIDEAPGTTETEVELAIVQPEELSKFDNILTTVFEFENKVAHLFSQTYRQPGWNHYFAKVKGESIAAASIFINGKFASLAIAGTLPEFRGLGAQKLLISKRINDAIEAGCNYIVVETAEDTADNPSASFRNMKKLGFELAYLRPNFIYNL